MKQFSDVRFPRRGNSTVIAFGRIATSIDAISMIKSDLGKGAATMLQFAIFCEYTHYFNFVPSNSSQNRFRKLRGAGT
ncbi:hypothetical protein KCX83_03035 [Brucella oryzae]|uniref:hypothetical protein n=1 Tax=Brucella oryzae TaxID=335286 RepID=UPI001B812AF0|nr:hypothetical protein [Brucella oryzae]MBR7651294.1 hypothetical protein [Brucella oryzae]